MPFETTTHFVAKPIPGPGQRLVHGRIVGPTDETYPAGTGGPLPKPSTLLFTVTKIVTVRDTNSGHTQTARSVYVMGSDPDGDKAAVRAQINPGSSIALGRPVVSATAPTLTGTTVTANAAGVTLTQAEADAKTTHHISAEDQHQMDAHYSRLDKADQRAFLEAYPNYVPGPGATSAVAEETTQGETGSAGEDRRSSQELENMSEKASTTAQEAPQAAPAQQAPTAVDQGTRTAFVAPKNAAKGPTTSAQINK